MPTHETYKGYYYIKFYNAIRGYTTRRSTGKLENGLINKITI